MKFLTISCATLGFLMGGMTTMAAADDFGPRFASLGASAFEDAPYQGTYSVADIAASLSMLEPAAGDEHTPQTAEQFLEASASFSPELAPRVEYKTHKR